jgi:hypothetical protein
LLGSRKAGLRFSVMPQLVQLPGVSLSTRSHIGQKYFFTGGRVGVTATFAI